MRAAICRTGRTVGCFMDGVSWMHAYMHVFSCVLAAACCTGTLPRAAELRLAEVETVLHNMSYSWQCNQQARGTFRVGVCQQESCNMLQAICAWNVSVAEGFCLSPLLNREPQLLVHVSRHQSMPQFFDTKIQPQGGMWMSMSNSLCPYASGCRYVVLHQDKGEPDPNHWRVAYKPSGHSWMGLSKEDAFGAALDYMDLVRVSMTAGGGWTFSVLQTLHVLCASCSSNINWMFTNSWQHFFGCLHNRSTIGAASVGLVCLMSSHGLS